MTTGAERRDAFLELLDGYIEIENSDKADLARLTDIVTEVLSRIGGRIYLTPSAVPLSIKEVRQNARPEWEGFEVYYFPGPAENYDVLHPESIIKGSPDGPLYLRTLQSDDRHAKFVHYPIKDPARINAFYQMTGLWEFFDAPGYEED